MSRIKTNYLPQGIRLISIDASRFKTNRFSVKFERPLCREEATFNALLPYVLESGTLLYPTRLDLYRRMQELYGANLDVSVSKTGERQFLNFSINFPSEAYIPDDILTESAALLFEVILHPILEDGVFRKKIVDIEKEAVKECVLGKINNKGTYAMERCIETMCANEQFSVSEDGYIDDLDDITPENLYAHYEKVIASSPIDVILSSFKEENELFKIMQPLLDVPRKDVLTRVVDQRKTVVQGVKHIRETMEMSQGKLIMGFRLGESLQEDDYEALSLYNGILGSGAHSKLFRNVREKNSLCYSIYSFTDRLKGLMFICAGIDAENLEKVQELIEIERCKMNSMDIEKDELNKTLASQINYLKSIGDDLGSLTGFYYAQMIQGMNLSPEELIQRLQNVSLEKIAEIGKKIQLDAVYFLSGQEA